MFSFKRHLMHECRHGLTADIKGHPKLVHHWEITSSFINTSLMSYTYETLVHLAAGGVGGTIGAIITCPLEVVKTRLQSSIVSLNFIPTQVTTSTATSTATAASTGRLTNHLFIARFIRHIIETEGTKALFKGLGPNLIGVAPSRAIYFSAYSTTKTFCNERFPAPDSPPVHICSAAAAGFVSSTATNPIWFVKTRLQLDER